MSDEPLPDPSLALTACYEHVRRTRMQGAPFVNEALDVEAVGFAPWQGYWLGVMVTPWFMNVVLAPREPRAWRSIAPGEKRCHRLPAGDFEFIGANETGIGEFCIASLFSPMLEFADHPTARFVAERARAALLEPSGDAREPGPGPLAVLDGALAAPLSRADLLHGRLGARDVDRR
jgi:[NiFe] hydrogenase assembly HybE family chaperone